MEANWSYICWCNRDGFASFNHAVTLKAIGDKFRKLSGAITNLVKFVAMSTAYTQFFFEDLATTDNPMNKMFWRNTKKIIGIGRNYAEHARELGNSIPSKPILFLKPTSSIIQMPQYIELPRNATVHYELELGVVMQGFARDVKEDRAMDYVKGYCLGLDMTARNIQEECKKAGNPWTVAKGYDTFTPLSAFIEKKLVKDPHNLQLQLFLDEKVAQDGNTRDMIFNIPKLISYCSSIMSLEDGDIILTGTPKGVGPVVPGQILIGKLYAADNLLQEMKFPVKNR